MDGKEQNWNIGADPGNRRSHWSLPVICTGKAGVLTWDAIDRKVGFDDLLAIQGDTNSNGKPDFTEVKLRRMRTPASALRATFRPAVQVALRRGFAIDVGDR